RPVPEGVRTGGAFGKDAHRVLQGGHRKGSHEHTRFVFLGYEFRARQARSRQGKYSTASARLSWLMEASRANRPPGQTRVMKCSANTRKRSWPELDTPALSKIALM